MGRENTGPEASEDIYRKAVHTKMQLFWILSACAHAFVCVWVWMSEWLGLNSAKIARQLNISRAAQMCQSRQKGLRRSYNFICQMAMKLNDFRDTLLNTSILYPFKIDWKRCHTQRLAGSGASVVWKVKSLCKRRGETGFKNSKASSWRKTITVNKSLVCELEDGEKLHALFKRQAVEKRPNKA